jgi:serine/threonine protein kinase/tetratricopeptide (TPR) repeat protein
MSPTEGIPGGTPGGAQNALEYDNFGNYQILRVLGEGGMGTVYLAEQTAPIHRMVALKVVKLGMDTSQVLSRFAYERQSVALMDHPHIARVYDAGATEKGRPFFVMEYVDGIPITRYCDEHRLNTVERLRLFVPVCEAVQHAHQKGVIHRDIKPSNVLVTEVDGHAIAKVIDFGIAKAMDQAGSDATLLTELGQFVGTPEYMSPEQADVMTGAVDATSDVYSLGVVLYELLAGAVPFDNATLRKAGMAELLRIIREEEAPSMSAKLTGLGASATEIAERRRTALAALRQELSGDLNWIVMKAVEKARERRYQAVADLAADINRHLEDRPVLASPPSRLYHVRKFVRRNKFAVLAGAVAAAALVAGFGAAVWQAGVARHERTVAVEQRTRAEANGAEAIARGHEAEIEKKRAEDNAADARRQEESAVQQAALAQSRLGDVSALANSMIFEIGDGLRDLSGTTATREAMVRRGVEYLNRMSEQESGGSGMQRQMATAWLKVSELQYDPGRSSLYDTAGARQSVARSLKLLEPLAKANPRDPELRHQLIQAYRRSAQLERTEAGKQAGLSRALQMAEQAVADQPTNLRAQADLADVYQLQEDYRRAVEIRQRIVAVNPKEAEARWRLYSSQILLGTSLLQKDDDLALKTLEPALSGLEALVREEPGNAQYQRDRAMALTQVGIEFVQHNRTGEAVEPARQAVALMTPLAAADPRNASFQMDLSLAHRGLGRVLVHAGRNAEALDYYQKALTSQEAEAAHYPENAEFAAMAAQIHAEIAGNLSSFLGPQAALTHRRAAESLNRTLVQEHPDRKEYARVLAASIVSLASATGSAGDRAAAMGFYREALQLAEKLCVGAGVSDEDWLARGEAYRGMAAGEQAMGRGPQAIAEYRSGIADYEKVVARTPKSKPAQQGFSASWRDLSWLYFGQHDIRQQVDAAVKALPFLEAEYAAGGRGDLTAVAPLLDFLYDLAGGYINLGEYDRGIEVDRRAVEIAGKMAADQPTSIQAASSVASANMHLGRIYMRAGRRDESIASHRRAWEALDRFPMERLDTPVLRAQWASTYAQIFEVLYRLQERDGLVALCRRVIAVLEPIYQAEPANQKYRLGLVTVYDYARYAIRDSSQIGEALEMARKAAPLDALAPVKNASFWAELAYRYAQIGSFQLQLGQSGEAAASWGKALDDFKRSREEAARVLAASAGDAAAQGSLRHAEHGLTALMELTGNREEALRWAKEALAHATAQSDADPKSPALRGNIGASREIAVRLQWLVSGEKGDYHSLFGREATPGQVRADLAAGWVQWAGYLRQVESPWPAQVGALRTAVDLYRRIEDSTPAAQANRAYVIGQLGQLLLLQSGAASAAEGLGELQEAAQVLTEALGVLTGLDRAGTLPASFSPFLGYLGSDLATVNAKLAVLRAAAR